MEGIERSRRLQSTMELTELVRKEAIIPEKSFLQSNKDGRLYKFVKTIPWLGNIGVVLRDDTGDVDVYSKNEFKDMDFYTVTLSEFTIEKFDDPVNFDDPA